PSRTPETWPGWGRSPPPGPARTPGSCVRGRLPPARSPRARTRGRTRPGPARAAAGLVLGGVRAGRGIVGLLRLPGDDPVLDVDFPRTRPGAVHPVGR